MLGGQSIPSLLFHSLYNGHLSTTATSLQWQLSSVPKVAVVERFNCRKLQCDEKRYPTFEQPGPEVPYSLKAVVCVASVSAQDRRESSDKCKKEE